MTSPASALCLALLILLPFSLARPLPHQPSALSISLSTSSFLRFLHRSFLHRASSEVSPQHFSRNPEVFNEPLPTHDADLDHLLSSVAQDYAEEISYLIHDPEFFNEQPFQTTQLFQRPPHRRMTRQGV